MPEKITLEERMMQQGMFVPAKSKRKTPVKIYRVPFENEDGGPGSGNHEHKGVEGQCGGSAPKFTDLIPEGSYLDSEEFKSLRKRWMDTDQKVKDARVKEKELEEKLKSESKPKPRNEWDEEDQIDALLGKRPTVFTEEGKKIKKELDAVTREQREAYNDRDELGNAMSELKEKAHEEQIKKWKSTEPTKAQSSEYEGFTLETTGVSDADDYIDSPLATLCEMSPKEYIERCAYDIFEGATIESTIKGAEEDNVRKYTAKMKSGDRFPLPYLNYKSKGQEGRHRALAAYNLGIEKIPVLVIGADARWDSKDTNLGAVGVLVIKDGKFLTGHRNGINGNGELCGPGGHIEEGENPVEAAVRETEEEFGITPTNLVYLGLGAKEEDGTEPYVFLCTDFEGNVHSNDNEMSDLAFRSPEDVEAENKFRPFDTSISLLLKTLSSNLPQSLDNFGNLRYNNNTPHTTTDGGKGSGNFGHEGVPGQVGGSAPAEGSKSNSISSRGKNVRCTGFEGKKHKKWHYGKHGKEFPGLDDKQYEERAKDLLESECSGDIDGYMTKDGEVVRFNKVTTEFAIGIPGSNVITLFKARYNKKKNRIEPERALKYFEENKAEDGVDDE